MNKIHLLKEYLFKIFNKKKKKIFFVFVFLFLGSFILISFFNFYLENTKIVPAKGGTHIEGIIGLPRFINPIYAPLSDIDRDLTHLVFSGLMKYNENNQIVPDLAKNYNVLEYGKIFEFYLREGLLWSDNVPLTVDDIIFTIRAVQNPALHSPIRAKWLGVEVEKVSELKIRFTLKNPSPLFLENATLGILPKHIWLNIPEEKFPLSKYNLQPVSSGLYKVKDFYQDEQGKIKSLNLVANPNYFGKQPYISQITFLFFNNQTELIKAFENNKITGFSIPIIGDKQNFKKNLKNKGFLTYRFLIPRYFALFFNQEKSKILERNKIRKALNYGTDRKNIIANIIPGQAEIVNSPILPEIFGFARPEEIQEFNPERATEIFIQEGFTEKKDGIRQKITRHYPAFQFKRDLRLGDRNNDVRELQRCLANFPEIYPEGVISGYFGQNTKAAVIRLQERYKEEILIPQNLLRGTGKIRESTRAKLNELCHKPIVETLPLKLSLTTLDQPLLIKIAEQLRSQWKKYGIKLEIKIFNISKLKQEIIRDRNYEILLFGQSLGAIPDPFPFWHSNQIKDPGLNLSLFKNRRADELLEKVRQTLDQEEQRKGLEEFQNILIKENPALFLFNPAILYFVFEEIKGISGKIIINPSKRFNNIENWYIETKRVWK
jgi:ABC-type transport system substrate-binding protein